MADVNIDYVYEGWRGFNIVLAVLSLVLNGTKVFPTIFKSMRSDERLGFLWAYGMNLAYCGSLIVYLALEGTAGPWSFIWTFPLLMGVYAGMMGRHRGREG